jgi:hypothetical protein
MKDKELTLYEELKRINVLNRIKKEIEEEKCLEKNYL